MFKHEIRFHYSTFKIHFNWKKNEQEIKRKIKIEQKISATWNSRGTSDGWIVSFSIYFSWQIVILWTTLWLSYTIHCTGFMLFFFCLFSTSRICTCKQFSNSKLVFSCVDTRRWERETKKNMRSKNTHVLTMFFRIYVDASHFPNVELICMHFFKFLFNILLLTKLYIQVDSR